MCRMIAKVSAVETSIIEEMLLCPVSLKYLSQNGLQPDAPGERGEHNDGCGMAFLQNGKIEIHKRDKASSWDDSYQAVVHSARSKIFIAHNRLASKGLNVSIDGAHPFFYQPGDMPYAFSHNGSVHSFIQEAQQSGTSDSNIFLRHLVDEKEMYPERSMESIVTSIARGKSYNSLCAFLLSPDCLQLWRIYNDTDPEKIKLYEDSYTLYISQRSESTIISSEPLDDGHWQLLPNKTFLTLQTAEGSLQLNYTTLTI